MIRTRHLAFLAAIVALAFASAAFAQTPLLVLDYNSAKTFGQVEIAGGAIDITNGAMIVNTATFGFVPTGNSGDNLVGTVGSPEYGDNAIHDALAEGANYGNGLWNGTNGIMSSWAANNGDGIAAVGWVDNSITQYASFDGISVTTNQSIIAATWYGDALLAGITSGDGYSAWLGTVLNPQGNTISANTGTAPVNWIDGDYFDQLVVGPPENDNYSAWLGAILDPYDPVNHPFGQYNLNWNPSYGSVTPASAAAAVPEPGTCVLLLSGLGLVLLGARSARKRSRLPFSHFNTRKHEVSPMSRTLKSSLPVIAALAVLALFAGTASANIYVDVQVDPTSPDYSAATPRALTFTSATESDTFILDVYALITPNGSNTATATNEGIASIASNFFVASSSPEGDVSWGSWITTGAGAINTNAAGKGVQYTTSYGGLGLGGSATTDNTQSHWWYAPTQTAPATGGTLLPSNSGVEYFLGTIDVSFANHLATLPATTTTFNMGSIPDYGNTTVANKKYSFVQDGTGTGSLQGSNALVGNGPSGTSLVSPFGAMSFTYSAGGPPPSNNPAQLSATLSVTGASTILGGASTGIGGSVSNVGTPTANTLNWAAFFPGSVSLNPASGGSLATGTPTPVSGTVTAPATGLGLWTISNVGFSGTDTTAGTSSTVSTPLSFTITGSGTTAGSPGQVGVYGTANTTQGTAAAGYNLAGLTSVIADPAAYSVGTGSATILAGVLGGSSTGITMQWRSRTNAELPQNSHAAAGLLPLYTDVVNLQGVTNNSSTYALQMSYDPTQADAASEASKGLLYLGYRNSGGTWVNATTVAADGNTGVGSLVASSSGTDFQGTFAQYTSGLGGGFTSLSQILGAWGVSTATDTAWAVVNHDAEFAVVPEPGTLALLGGGVAALVLAYRRRRKLAKV